MTDHVTYFRCKYCKRIFSFAAEDRLNEGPLPMERAVAVVLAGLLDDRFNACVHCCFDATIPHKGTDHYPSHGGHGHITRDYSE